MTAPAELLRRHRLRPKKDWGQNFLGDDHVLQRIAEACGAGPGDTVVELGAGLGHLTRKLAATGASVVAIERDRELVPILEEELRLPNVRVVAANAAEIDFAEVAGAPRPIVAGNLPYHLSSSILFQVLEQHASVKRAIFLLQKEVAERIAEPPGGRTYGLLSALLQTYGSVETLFEVPRHFFLPPPNVDSAVLRIELLECPPRLPRDARRYVRLVKAAFAHRRKTLLNSLKGDRSLGEPGSAARWLDRAGIDPERRAETLAPSEFVSIEWAMANDGELE